MDAVQAGGDHHEHEKEAVQAGGDHYEQIVGRTNQEVPWEICLTVEVG